MAVVTGLSGGVSVTILMLTAVALALLLGGGGIGWTMRGVFRDHRLEMNAQAADINWLRAALADSERRCEQQASWLTVMEEELVDLRGPDGKTQPPRTATARSI
ncbi:hypothetical protein [Pseudorhodobacter sp.]|uniref:hypothetical protein n=1 Tax=Pseudorhodobacter sp. TaxID=1934400 RepID=UPI00264701CA|nr:hypothetical protein [Pseudorhodobacter sp.]MDN5786700.1 hypothetical protein [Pseudorhodobacter sp.]